jgi:hypothetical protein
MAVWTLVLRSLSLLALAVWVGGFTFYSAVVIPALHEAMGSVEAGLITQRVTDTLNAIGAAAVVLCWLWAAVERPTDAVRWNRARLGLLATSTLLLVILIALHRVMDRRLETSGLRGFYRLHRAYLLASTAQWAANLGLLLICAFGWRDQGKLARREGGASELR